MIEQMVNAERYKSRLASAMVLACRKLTQTERHLLLWRYENELPLSEIAELLGIRPSGVKPQLRLVRCKLRDYVICCLSAEEGMSGRAIAECLQDIVENPYYAVSLLDCLKESPSTRKPPASDHGLPGKLRLRLVKR